MNILVIGAGYVGLVTAACMAEMGHHVLCLDISREKIDGLKQGIIPIYEPGLKELIQKEQKTGRLSFTSSYEEALQNIEVCFIAVATPQQKDGSCDIEYVLQASRSVGRYLQGSLLVVIKSTVPPGTSDLVESTIQEEVQKRGLESSIDVVFNPEFLKEGAAIADCMKPDRIIVGTKSPLAAKIMRELYNPFMMNHDRMLLMSIRSAEMTKYAANAMLATRISFMNELSHLCEKVGADISEVRVGIGSDQRIGYQFLYAGVGYGGSCFPKDLRALQALARQQQVKSALIDAVEAINERQKLHLVEKIATYFSSQGGLQGKTLAIWGLSFKPGTDDMREAPSIAIITALLSKGVSLRLFDPISMENAKNHLPTKEAIVFCKDEYESVQDVDGVVLVTEWKQLRFVNLDEVQHRMKGKAFFDGRNQYKARDMKHRGFDYYAIGIPSDYEKACQSP